MKRYWYEKNSTELSGACAAALAIAGSVVLLPTETVYGLVTRWGDAAGIDRIYALKERDRGKPLAMFGRDVAALRAAGGVVSPAAERLIARFCPGPVTLIVPSRDGGTVGFRIPDHPLVLALLEAVPFPLASTSANLSGTPNALTVDEALAGLRGEPEVVIDAGGIPAGARASTVIDLSGPELRILRHGPIDEWAIREALL